MAFVLVFKGLKYSCYFVDQSRTVVGPDLELGGEGGTVLICPAGFSPFGHFFLFLPKIRRGRPPRTPPLDPPLIFVPPNIVS